MVFSTTSFLFVFLPIFLLCYALLPWRNLTALVFSLLFFAWGEGAYVLLLLATVGFNYFLGQHLEAGSRRSQFLALGVAANLLVLGYYKYFGFLIGSVLEIPIPPEDIPHLPLGISFFIFQSISYLIDVYRGDSPRARSYFDLALYIAMFPQLIAGPIVRYATVAEAIRHRQISSYDVYRGVILFIVGLSYKVLIANNAAQVADTVFGFAPGRLSTANAWTGIVAYTLQIFFDFAGYSLMAIGIGRIMGFHFPKNFDFPYTSRSITDFWRRWHMSLSSWFRDYLYIPLGGNRHGPYRTYVNLFTVFLLCGLWHGAAWTFIIWGVFHGLILAVERAGLGAALQKIPRPAQHVYAMLLVMIGWVLFRAETLPQAMYYLEAMFSSVPAKGISFVRLVSTENLSFMLLGVIFAMPVLERTRAFRNGEDPDDVDPGGATLRDARGGHWIYRAANGVVALALLLMCSTYIMSGTYNPFIYFRF
ncbi:MBOAT family O-acyltransferase [Congregibacter litoralis]|uniref:Probable alginate O-acetylase n=1 Tax=Congregibacter litoralis KT71 TaxID=314285 RepID=A4AA37_9GAMM|nr:MBOAT family protein [Congregibacter litoralis]EAQ97354.1 putative membrane protein involved in D-alanine export [Congregibacter litoralis KT71]